MGDSPSKEFPVLETPRLFLREFTLADAADVQRLAGDRDIAATTLNIPHPYEDGMAEQWLSSLAEAYARGEHVTFAVTRRREQTLIGAVGLNINREADRAEMGYWIGKPYWNQGYGTEAAKAVLRYGFEELALHRIYAAHFKRNPGSGRVMEKIGMQYEGCLREHVKKWDAFEDLVYYGILRHEYESKVGLH